MTSARSLDGKGYGVHFPPSLATDDRGVIVPVPTTALPEIAAKVDPTDLLYFAQRLLKGAHRRRHQLRWSAINAQRLELARLCINRAASDPHMVGMVQA